MLSTDNAFSSSASESAWQLSNPVRIVKFSFCGQSILVRDLQKENAPIPISESVSGRFSDVIPVYSNACTPILSTLPRFRDVRSSQLPNAPFSMCFTQSGMVSSVIPVAANALSPPMEVNPVQLEKSTDVRNSSWKNAYDSIEASFSGNVTDWTDVPANAHSPIVRDCVHLEKSMFVNPGTSWKAYPPILVRFAGNITDVSVSLCPPEFPNALTSILVTGFPSISSGKTISDTVSSPPVITISSPSIR